MRQPATTALEDRRSCKYCPSDHYTDASSSPFALDPIVDILREEYIVATFGFELRRTAIRDKLMRITGVTDFVVTVLVPELVVMLIKEDMRVDDEEAQRIFQESRSLGEILGDEGSIL